MKKYRVSTLSEKALYIAIGGILLLTPVGVSAAETNLSKALKSGKKTIEFTGKEKQSVRIPKGVTVIGSGPEKSVISNDIVLADGASLKNLTVSGKVIAITLDKGASVTLENVTVTGASDSGVFAPLGGGTLTMKNSRVQNNRKGIFLLKGVKASIFLVLLCRATKKKAWIYTEEQADHLRVMYLVKTAKVV